MRADRHEVMPLDWVSDVQNDAAVAVEVTYLDALETAQISWLGQAGRAEYRSRASRTD